MNHWLLTWLIIVSWTSYLPLQNAQSTVSFNNVQASGKFGEWIRFEANIEIPPVQNIKQVYLFIQPEGQNTLLEEVQIENGALTFQYDLKQYHLRPFSQVNYWFRVYLENGQEFISPQYSYVYNDTRFEWQILDNDMFQIGWYQGDMEFGQAIMNVAQNGLQSLQTYIPGSLQNKVKIYVYATASDLQTAINASGESWVAGHASPDINIILISIPPGPEARIEMERQIPHELMHLMQYSIMGESYSKMPKWLIEGLASLAELYPNTEYQLTLQTATENETLYAISDLCTTFPTDSSGVFLAYAESASFVRFLHKKYGTSGIYGLINAYKDGIGCEEGFETAFNTPLSQLEHRWQQESLGVDAEWLVFENLSPYIFMLVLVIFIPLAGVIQQNTLGRNESGNKDG